MAIMTAEEAAEWGKTLSFEKVWSALMETRENIERMSREADKRFEEMREQSRKADKRFEEMREQSRKTDEQIKKTDEQIKKTDEQIKKTDEQIKKTEAQVEKTSQEVDRLAKNVGGLNHSVGALVEILVAAHLWEKFPEYNLQRAYRRLPLYDEKNEPKGEIDILLVNTEWAMAVEVKREADSKDVEHHLERMTRILQYPPAELKLAPGVKLLGALAGGIVTQEGKEAAHKAGFYVLELTGEAVIRIPDPPGFKPKTWLHTSGRERN